MQRCSIFPRPVQLQGMVQPFPHPPGSIPTIPIVNNFPNKFSYPPHPDSFRVMMTETSAACHYSKIHARSLSYGANLSPLSHALCPRLGHFTLQNGHLKRNGLAWRPVTGRLAMQTKDHHRRQIISLAPNNGVVITGNRFINYL